MCRTVNTHYLMFAVEIIMNWPCDISTIGSFDVFVIRRSAAMREYETTMEISSSTLKINDPNT